MFQSITKNLFVFVLEEGAASFLCRKRGVAHSWCHQSDNQHTNNGNYTEICKCMELWSKD